MRRAFSAAVNKPNYRIDFALTVIAGNLTRYMLTRPLVEGDPTVAARWYPIRTWVPGDPLRFLPSFLRLRLRHLLDSWRLYVRSPADAIVIHAFETYWMYTMFKSLLRRKTLIVYNPDGERVANQQWLRDYAVRRTHLFVPWSNYVADRLRERHPNIEDGRTLVLHPGIDLGEWPMRPPPAPNPRFRLLFVASDFMLKGGDTLLQAFEDCLCDTCELHIVTKSSLLPPFVKSRILGLDNAHLYLDLPPGSVELKQLYRVSDALIHPTNRDSSSWVALEAMATGIPVVISPQGGIRDIVRHGETGLHIPPKDPEAIADAVEALRKSPELRDRLIRQGRSHVEANYDAERNTERLISEIKGMILGRRREPSRVSYGV